MKINIHHSYTKEHDILGVSWKFKGCPIAYSQEIQNPEGHDFVVDFDEKGRIVGIEIFDWNKGSESVRKNIARVSDSQKTGEKNGK